MIRRRNPALTQTRILDAAESRFAREGFAGASMSGIAATARVTQSLLHHYFKSKRSLWRAVFARHAERYLAAQQPALEGAASLEEALETDFRYWLAHPVLLRLQAWAVVEGGDHLGRARDAMYAPFIARARAAQKQGLLRKDIEPVHLVTIAAAAVTFWIEYRDELAPHLPKGGRDERFLADLLKILFNGARK